MKIPCIFFFSFSILVVVPSCRTRYYGDRAKTSSSLIANIDFTDSKQVSDNAMLIGAEFSRRRQDSGINFPVPEFGPLLKQHHRLAQNSLALAREGKIEQIDPKDNWIDRTDGSLSMQVPKRIEKNRESLTEAENYDHAENIIKIEDFDKLGYEQAWKLLSGLLWIIGGGKGTREFRSDVLKNQGFFVPFVNYKQDKMQFLRMRKAFLYPVEIVASSISRNGERLYSPLQWLDQVLVFNLNFISKDRSYYTNCMPQNQENWVTTFECRTQDSKELDTLFAQVEAAKEVALEDFLFRMFFLENANPTLQSIKRHSKMYQALDQYFGGSPVLINKSKTQLLKEALTRHCSKFGIGSSEHLSAARKMITEVKESRGESFQDVDVFQAALIYCGIRNIEATRDDSTQTGG